METRLRRNRQDPSHRQATAYDAFISYSHAADGKLAPALQSGLQRLAKPWYKPRALRIFRDDTGLAVNPHLWSSVSTAMEQSRYFLLLCSPEAAASPWVNREVEHWLANQPVEHILPVLTEGTLVWDPARGDYDPEASSALPPALVGRFTDEPRHLDLRWARDEEHLDLRHSRFREAVADLAAPLHGMAKDELEGEDIRQHQRARRLARGAVAGLAVLLVASLIAGGLAVANARQADRQSERAEREATVARARGLAGQAAARADSAPDLALLLALEADRLDDSVESRGALLTALDQTNRLRKIVTGFPAEETVVGLSDDGGTLALSDPGGRVRLLDVDTRDPLASFATGQRGPVNVFFSPDGTAVATTSEDTTVRLWDAESGRERSPVLRGHAAPVRTADFSGDGRLLATADSTGQVVLWDVATGRFLSRPAPTVVIPIFGLAFSPDGNRIALAGFQTRVFKVADGGRSVGSEFVLEGLSHTVAFSADNSLLAVARADDRLVDVWDLASRQRRLSLRLPEATDVSALSFALSFSRDGRTLASGNDDGTTVVWDLASGPRVGRALVGLRGAAEHVTIGEDASHVTTASATGVASWNLEGTALSTRRSIAKSFGLHDVAFSPDGDLATIDDADGQLTFRDGATLEPRGAPVATLNGNCCRVDVAFSPDGRSVVAGRGDHLSSIDVRSGAPDRPALDMRAQLTDLEFSRDGTLLAVGLGNGTAAIVDVERWSVERRVAAAAGREVGNSPSRDRTTYGRDTGVALSPDGRRLATVGNEGRVVVQNVDGGGRTTLAEGRGPAYAVDFSADGRHLAAGFANGTALLIDIRRRQTTSVALVGHAGYIFDLAFSSDDQLLAVASFSGVTIWDVASRARVGELAGKGLPSEVAFSPDGSSLATMWGDLLIVFELDPREWRRRACEIAGRNLTSTEWSQYVGAEPYRPTCRQWPEG